MVYGRAAGPIIYERKFRRRGEFDDFIAENPDVCSDDCEHIIVTHVQRWGVQTEFFGAIGSHEIVLIGSEPREHLLARGFSARQRAVLDRLLAYLASNSIEIENAKIHGHEAVTQFALLMRGRFPKYIGTEYAKNDQQKRDLFPIQHEDVCALSFSEGVFDAVISGDVFEHVPDIDAALREAARTLRKGGCFIGTFPFLYWADRSIRQAKLEEERIVHLRSPIYHGDPLNPNEGSLVFELPAWDLLDRAQQAGFSDAVFEFVCHQQKGISASYQGAPIRPRGVFVAVFRH